MTIVTVSVVKKRNRSSYRVVRRCFVFLITVSIVPVILVLLITTDQYFKPYNRHGLGGALQDDYDQYSLGITSGNNTMTMNMEAIGERMIERRQHMREQCHRHGLDAEGNDSLHHGNPWEFLINRKYHIVWCNVFKVASTSWMYNFNLLAGYDANFLKKTKLVPLYLARKKYQRPTLPELEAALNDSTAFLIVRHPLERLLSAYRDKIQFCLPHTFHQKLGNQIIAKYRKGGSKGPRGNNPRWPTFFEFVQYLLDSYHNEQPLDMHWTPITNFCTPCLIRFDIIAKFETLREDQTFLIHETGLQDIIRPQWRNSGRGRTTAELITSHYSQLTKSQIRQLYHIFRYDFDLFNYTLKGYIELGRDDPPTKIPTVKLTTKKATDLT